MTEFGIEFFSEYSLEIKKPSLLVYVIKRFTLAVVTVLSIIVGFFDFLLNSVDINYVYAVTAIITGLIIVLGSYLVLSNKPKYNKKIFFCFTIIISIIISVFNNIDTLLFYYSLAALFLFSIILRWIVQGLNDHRDEFKIKNRIIILKNYINYCKENDIDKVTFLKMKYLLTNASIKTSKIVFDEEYLENLYLLFDLELKEKLN